MPQAEGNVPSTLHVRLDDELRPLLTAYMRESKLSLSAVVRVLLKLGLARADQEIATVYRRAIEREGLAAGMAKFKQRVSQTYADILEEDAN